MYFNHAFGGVIPGARGAVLAVLLRTGEPLTGRQIHGMTSDEHSLWSVQEALKALGALGLISTRTVGRAGLHVVNEAHASIGPLRALLDPMAELRATVSEAAGSDVDAVVLFGSIARRQATETSDIDLAVIAATGWYGRIELEDIVKGRLGNDCDVLVFTAAEFVERARAGGRANQSWQTSCVTASHWWDKSRGGGAVPDSDSGAAQPRAHLPQEGRGVRRVRRSEPRGRTVHACGR